MVRHEPVGGRCHRRRDRGRGALRSSLGEYPRYPWCLLVRDLKGRGLLQRVWHLNIVLEREKDAGVQV